MRGGRCGRGSIRESTGVESGESWCLPFGHVLDASVGRIRDSTLFPKRTEVMHLMRMKNRSLGGKERKNKHDKILKKRQW